jgi:hypothetical protein
MKLNNANKIKGEYERRRNYLHEVFDYPRANHLLARHVIQFYQLGKCGGGRNDQLAVFLVRGFDSLDRNISII